MTGRAARKGQSTTCRCSPPILAPQRRKTRRTPLWLRSTDDQFTAEAFYRFTVSPNFAITPSIQHIINPVLDPSQNSITILGIRGRVAM
jgi:carbohydrate-selective porin OprB